MSIDKSKAFKKKKSLRLSRYIKPDALKYALALICGLYKFLVPIFFIWVFGMSIEILTQYENGEISNHEAWSKILHYGLIILASLLISPLPVYYRSYFAARAVSASIKRIRCDLYSHIHRLSHSFFDKTKSGSLVSRLIGDIDSIERFLENAFITIWMHMGKAVIIIIYLFSLNWRLTLVAIALIPLQILIFLRIGAKMKAVSVNVRSRTAELAGNSQEKLAGVTVVKSFTGEHEESRLFNQQSDKLQQAKVQAGSLSGISQAIIQLLNNLGPLFILLAGGLMALYGRNLLSISVLVQFMMLQKQLYEPFAYLSDTILISAEALGALDRIEKLFGIRPDVENRGNPVFPGKLKGDIELQDVHFSYGNQEQYILCGVSLTMKAGQTTALVGESGGGKSTVIKLIKRFYDVSEGALLIDDVDIRDYDVQSIREKIALVPQDPILFSGSIRENILYGRMDATDDEIQKAAEDAFAMDFIRNLPDGIHTKVGERGLMLSGGQRQRISIARAFLKDPAVIIFDEATSALDNESEVMVQKAMDRLMKNRTAIIIAHRLSTIQNADQIAVIEQGKVIEIGKHAELLKTKGRYFELNNSSETKEQI